MSDEICFLSRHSMTLLPRFSSLSDFSSLVVAVNWEYSDFNLVLNENDEVALIPPVSGGMY